MTEVSITGTGYFSVWITVLLASTQNKIAAILVGAGFSVQALCSDGKVCHDSKLPNMPCHTLAFVIGGKPTLASGELRSQLIKLLQENGINYLTLIVSRSLDCAWVGANFHLETVMQSPSKTTDKLN